jgi:hypothetical protein
MSLSRQFLGAQSKTVRWPAFGNPRNLLMDEPRCALKLEISAHLAMSSFVI